MIKYAQDIDLELLLRDARTPGTEAHRLAQTGALAQWGIYPDPTLWQRTTAAMGRGVDATGRFFKTLFEPSPGPKPGFGGAPGVHVPLNNYPTYVAKKPVPAPAPAAAPAPVRLNPAYNPAINAPALAIGDQIAAANANAILQESLPSLGDEILRNQIDNVGDSVQQQLYANVKAQEDAQKLAVIAQQHPELYKQIVQAQQQQKAQIAQQQAQARAAQEKIKAQDEAFGEALAGFNPFGMNGYEDIDAFDGLDQADTSEADPEAVTQNAKAIQNIQDTPIEYVRNEDYPVVPALPTQSNRPSNPLSSPAISAAVDNNVANLAAQTAVNNLNIPAYTSQDAEEVQNNIHAFGQQLAASMPQGQSQQELMPSFAPETLQQPSLWDRATNYMSAHPLRTAGAAAALGALGLGAIAYNTGKGGKKRKKN